MADTPRGPRPTITRRTAALLVAGWTLVMLLLAGAALHVRSSPEPGWERERLRITNLPYADCSGGGGCTMRPTVELPDGSRRQVQLTIRHPDELLPSQHFSKDGTLLLWIKAGEQPRSVRPIVGSARVLSWALTAAATLLAAVLVRLAVRASRLHHKDRAGHVTDHVVVWVVPLLAVMLAVTLLMMQLAWRTPVHEPTRPVASSG